MCIPTLHIYIHMSMHIHTYKVNTLISCSKGCFTLTTGVFQEERQLGRAGGRVLRLGNCIETNGVCAWSGWEWRTKSSLPVTKRDIRQIRKEGL